MLLPVSRFIYCAAYLGVSVLLAACSPKEDKACSEGDEGCACYPNKTCNDELVCLSKLCVDPDGKPDTPPKGNDAGGNDQDGSTTPSNSGVKPLNSSFDPTPPDGGQTPASTVPGNSSAEPASSNAPSGGKTPVEIHGQLRVVGRQLTDEHDNPVQLKGVSTMWLNWDDADYSQSLAGMRSMRDDWKLTVIRAAMGIEADDTDVYLEDPAAMKAKVTKVVDNAIELGVYVIIDWHDHNAIAHSTEAAAFFDEISAKYKDVPNVLYETFNEPLDDVSWSAVRDYHTSISSVIRQNDPDNVIILGSPNWSQDVDVAASSPVAGTNLMYTVHFYACSHQAYQRAKAQAAYNAGLPLFVTEWGATHADGGVDGIVCEAAAADWLDWLDDSGISWAAWKLDGCEDSSCLFKSRSVSTEGGWTSSDLNGHAPFVISRMQAATSVGPAPTSVVIPSTSPTTTEPPDTCVPVGTCASGDGEDCVGGALVERNCSACGVIAGCTDCCNAIGALGAIWYPDFIEQPALISDFNMQAGSADIATDFTSYNQMGALTFGLTGLYDIYAGSLTIGLEYSGGTVSVSLEDGAAGCQYYGTVNSGVWVATTTNTCWGGFDLYSLSRQINVRIESLGSGSASLSVSSIIW